MSLLLRKLDSSRREMHTAQETGSKSNDFLATGTVLQCTSFRSIKNDNFLTYTLQLYGTVSQYKIKQNLRKPNASHVTPDQPPVNFSQANLLVAVLKIMDNIFMNKSKWHVTADGNICQNLIIFKRTRKKSITMEKHSYW